MNVFALMAGVTACYTVSSLSDKYAAAKAEFAPGEFTFLMCASMSVFLALTLPFRNIAFSLCWQSFAGVALVTLCKLLEFRMSILVLSEMSAFELKAWLGVTLFVISLIRRETCSKANVLGGVLTVAGVMGFRFCG